MDNLGIEDLKQLVTFYKQRANELEFLGLQNQLVINNLIKQNAELQAQTTSSEQPESTVTKKVIKK